MVYGKPDNFQERIEVGNLIKTVQRRNVKKKKLRKRKDFKKMYFNTNMNFKNIHNLKLKKKKEKTKMLDLLKTLFL